MYNTDLMIRFFHNFTIENSYMKEVYDNICERSCL